MAIDKSHLARIVSGDTLPTFREMTEDLAPVNPLCLEHGFINPKTGQKLIGVPLGIAGLGGIAGNFEFCEYTAHQADPETAFSLNSIVFGQTGYRKSSGEKIRILRDTLLFSRNYLVTDRKGEYRVLAGYIDGAKVLNFSDNAQYFINPLDPVMGLDAQLELLTALIVTAGKHFTQGLTPLENTLLWNSIIECHNSPGIIGIPTLPSLIEKLRNPSASTVEDLSVGNIDDINKLSANLRLTLERLSEKGNLAGMFHKPTTPGLFDAVPLLVLDCEGLDGEKAVVMTTLINFFTLEKNAKSSSDNRFHHVIHDESWDLAAYSGFVSSVRRAYKLGRSKGFGNRMVVHHWQNLIRSATSQIEDIASDTSLVISYRQNRAELEASSHLFGYTDNEIERIVKLPQGHALYKFTTGNIPALEVRYVAMPWEIPLLETSHLVKGKSGLSSSELASTS